jgi:hypothetical protein
MSIGSASHTALSCAAALVAGATVASAQITITSADMFNQVGQYYLAYANTPGEIVSVSSMLGTAGGPQAWDFSSGPQDVTYRFDYLAAANGQNGADFVSVGAQIVEVKTDLANTNSQSWLYFKQDPVNGRVDYGFWDLSFSASQPESVFTNGLQDFPSSIHYRDSWSGSTVFYSIYSDPTLGDYPEQLTYSSTDTVDAYGYVTLPIIGFLECLRVHELVVYDIALDLGDGYQSVATEYILNYYWLAPGHGIPVQITSTQSESGPPPDNLPGGAAVLSRMFQAHHTGSVTNPLPIIHGFKITLGKTAALLQWTAQTGISSYRVDYTTNLAGTINWQVLGSTSSNFVLDPAAATPAAPVRYYRVVGTPSSK